MPYQVTQILEHQVDKIGQIVGFVLGPRLDNDHITGQVATADGFSRGGQSADVGSKAFGESPAQNKADGHCNGIPQDTADFGRITQMFDESGTECHRSDDHDETENEFMAYGYAHTISPSTNRSCVDSW